MPTRPLVAVVSRRRAKAGQGERGERGAAVSVWVSVALVAFIVCVGLGVDFAGHATAEQDARAVAAEAARAGGQFLEIRPGAIPRPDVYAATQAASAYVAGSAFSGSARVEAGVVRVSVTGAYRTQFLGIIGIGSLPVRAEGAAAVTPVIDGSES